MKKAIVALAIAALASTASAAISGSKHDLSVGFNGKAATLSSCNFCHAPHNANTTATYADVPLWNRNTSSATLTVKATGTGATPAPGGHSLTCLSCHDGVADVGATFSGSNGLATPPNRIPTAGVTVPGSNTGSTFDGTNYIAAAAGTADLRDDHPVGVPLVVAADYALAAAVTGAGGLELYGATNTVECSSCHDPHLTTFTPFLRKASTALCSTCHLK